MRRDKLDLLRDILAVCSEKKAKKTEIVYRSNMNFLKRISKNLFNRNVYILLISYYIL